MSNSVVNPCATNATQDRAADLLHSEITAAVREEVGMNEAFASQIAGAIVRGLSRRLGAQRIYIPAPDRSTRDADIYDRFIGSNARELCAEYGISRSRLYEVVNRERARRGLGKLVMGAVE
jgi:Mor family transcriptional regulator